MKTILNEIQEKKQVIQATCNGRKSCGKCKVQILEKDVTVVEEEKSFLTQQEIENGIRLACCHEASSIQYVIFNEDMDILDDLYVQKIEKCEEKGLGIIVDIGTTTVVMKWISLKDGQCLKSVSFKNPQATYGGDVISRIEYDQKNPHVLNEVLIKK